MNRREQLGPSACAYLLDDGTIVLHDGAVTLALKPDAVAHLARLLPSEFARRIRDRSAPLGWLKVCSENHATTLDSKSGKDAT